MSGEVEGERRLEPADGDAKWMGTRAGEAGEGKRMSHHHHHLSLKLVFSVGI